jgi:hypothetical protein
VNVIIVGPHRLADQTKEDVMAKFVYLYSGARWPRPPRLKPSRCGSGAPGSVLSAMVRRHRKPFGAGSTLTADGATTGGASKLGGYSIVEATSLDEAASKADGCPVLISGGSVEVYEAIPM